MVGHDIVDSGRGSLQTMQIVSCMGEVSGERARENASFPSAGQRVSEIYHHYSSTYICILYLQKENMFSELP